MSASLDIDIHYTIEPLGQETSVARKVDFTIQVPKLMSLVKPLVEVAFRTENERILAELKRYVEAQSR
ncbi:MAG: hypothetical protein JO300_15830 [Silvibacterium sp.]|nr:hypothetical protein [Silvibacterium sp.]MBV8438884.1 hypothetical protein [Silvibacterium sp.]